MSVIKLEGITKSYTMGQEEVEILHGVSLNIERGEMTALMGSSGSGKSTMMNIIGLLDRPNNGTYYLDGKDVSTLKDDDMAAIRNEMIGFVFQQFFLLSKLTAEQNVGLALSYRNAPKKEIKERSLEMLSRVGMAERAHHKPSELSGGQQQRVALARALVGNPSIILADEPTGALDSRTGKEVMELFLELNHKEGRTLLIVTHDDGVGAQCGRRVHVSDGNILRED